MKTKAARGWPPLVTEEDELQRQLVVARAALEDIARGKLSLNVESGATTHQTIARKALEEMGSGERRLSSDGRDVMRTYSPQRGETKAGSSRSAMAGNPAESDPAAPSESQGSGGADFIRQLCDALDSAHTEIERLKDKTLGVDCSAGVCDALHRRAERAEKERALARQELDCAVNTVVRIIGGVDYEGFPTSSINYLQRLRILVENEQERDAWKARAEEFEKRAAIPDSELQERDDLEADVGALEEERDALKEELVKAQQKLDNLEIDCNHDMGIELRQTRAERDEAIAALPCSSGRDENRAAKMLGKTLRYQVDKYKSIAVIEYSVAKEALISACAEANTLRRERDEARNQLHLTRSGHDISDEYNTETVRQLVRDRDESRAEVERLREAISGAIPILNLVRRYGYGSNAHARRADDWVADHKEICASFNPEKPEA